MNDFRPRLNKLAFDVYAAQQKWRLIDFLDKSEDEVVKYINKQLGLFMAVSNLPVLWRVKSILGEYERASEN